MIKKNKSTDSVGKQLEDQVVQAQVAQAKTGFAEAGSKSSHSVSSKDTAHGNKGKSVAKKTDEDELDLSLNTGAESAADPIVLAQAETGTATDAATAGSSSSAAGTAGGGAGSAAAGAATGAEGAGAFALSDAALGTMILAGTVGVVAIASTGGGSAAAVAATPATGFTLTGIVAAGAVVAGHGLTVEAFKADGTQLAGGTATVGSSGTFTINITENYSGPVLVRVVDTSTGNDYTHEATGNPTDLTADLRAMVNVSGNGTITVNVTPVTELAVRELVGDAGGDGGTSVAVLGATVTTTQVTTANTAVQSALGLTGDIVTTTPVTVDAAGFATATATQKVYGQVLAAIAGAEPVPGTDTGAVLNTLAQSVSGSTLDQVAVDLLIAGATTVDAVYPTAGAAAVLTTLIGGNISAIDISADTGSNVNDFITQTAAQTITATLDAALSGTKLWGSVDGGTTWTDISSFVAGTALTWTGVTLAGSSSIKLAVTADTVGAGTVPAFTGATASVVGSISTQSYSVDTTAPAFTSAATGSFAENGTGATYKAVSTDTNLVTYTLSGGADASLFNFDANSGVATFKTVPNFESAADAGADNVYDISVTATDGAGNASTQAVAITVTNVNEAPTLTSGAAASFAENGTGTVHTVTATDPDVPTTLTYALAGADAALFNISTSTGAVTFKTAPNFEAPTDAGANNVYDITVTASDGALSTAAQAVSITVTNVNEAPTLTSSAAASFTENGTAAAYTVTATDPENATLTYALAGTDAALFNINASTGAVTFATASNFELPADAGGNNVYDITVTASDGTNTTAAQAVAITVTNVNEAPTLTGPASTTTLAINQVFSDNVSNLFSDVDAADVLSYSATGLPTGITLNTTTGAIGGTPTATGTATVVITATDSGGLNVSHTETINVVTAPVISSIASSVAQAKSGDALTFTATISEAVTVTGTPTLTLDVGGTAMTATYTGGTGTAALTFTATTPATGDDATVTVTGINLGAGGSVTGNVTTQPLVTTTTGQVVTAFVVDNSNPVFTSAATANAAENQTAAYTSATTDGTAVTYTLGGGADVALFNINASTGAVTFKTAPNFEVPTDAGADKVYDVTVTATDALGHASNQAAAITVTNVNEAPTVASGVPTTDTLVIGQALSGKEVASLFVDVDAGDTLTYSQTGLPTELTLNPSTGVITGTPVTHNITNITFTATDSGGLTTSHTIAVSFVSAPTLTSTIDNVTNFEVTSNIVMTASENVTAVAGKYIHIINDANDTTNAGFHGEATVNTQDILVTDAAVTITNNTITINPGFDLDFSNNYHITVDAGAFLGVTSGQGSVAAADATMMNFSTVLPAASATAAASQAMTGGTDAMVAGRSWWDAEGFGAPGGASVARDFAAGDFAIAANDLATTGIATNDFYIAVNNFAAGDLIYVDNHGDNTVQRQTDFNAGLVLDLLGVAPTTIITGASATATGQNGGQFDVTLEGSTASFADTVALQVLLGNVTYQPVLYG